MREIQLTKGQVAIVDDDDFPAVSSFRWCIWGSYAARKDGGKLLTMHRFLMGGMPGMFIDHINRNKLDNRRCNLRFATPSQNQMNRRGSSETGYKGVTRDRGRYKAHITIGAKSLNLGRYESAGDAAMAYDAAASQHFGEFALLNFPNVPVRDSAISRGTISRLDALRRKVECKCCGRALSVAGMGQHAKACKSDWS